MKFRLIKVLRKLAQLRQRERWTRPQLLAYQNTALQQLREYAYARSPFYRRFHRGLFGRPLQSARAR